MCHVFPFDFFSTGDRYELDCCTSDPSVDNTGKILNYPSCLYSSDTAKVVQCFAHSCSVLEHAVGFLASAGFLEAVTQQQRQQNNLPKTRSEVSARLKHFQLSTF